MTAICGVLKTAVIVWGIVEIVRMLLLCVIIDSGDAELKDEMFERHWFNKRKKDENNGWQK